MDKFIIYMELYNTPKTIAKPTNWRESASRREGRERHRANREESA